MSLPRQRMLDDMALRKLSEKTQSASNGAVRGFAGYLRRRSDTASAEDLPRYQLHLAKAGFSPVSINAALTALMFRTPSMGTFLEVEVLSQAGHSE